MIYMFVLDKLREVFKNDDGVLEVLKGESWDLKLKYII